MIYRRIILLVLPVFLTISCTKDIGPYEPEVVLTTVSFSTDIQPIFDTNCISCHNTANNQFYAYLDLSNGVSYADLVNVTSNGYAPNKRVVTGDAAASVLWGKVNNSLAFGSNMPLGGELSSAEKELIRVWINEGALDN